MKNLGRSYLIGELGKRGLSRRGSKRILNFIFAEMKRALARNEPVEFPFGWLELREKDSPFFEWDGEPLKPYTVEHYTDAEGIKLLGGLKNLSDEPILGWNCVLSKIETPPYTHKPRRPRGRPSKRPTTATAG